VTSGLKKEGAIIVNTNKSPEEIRPQLEGYEGLVCTIDASTIAEEELNNRNFPNIAMMGAVVKVSGIMAEHDLIKDMDSSLQHKFASKPHVIEGNMKALKRSMKEVKGL
jgi:pyruvate ferredoxin oxidoreductase gamma subunit